MIKYLIENNKEEWFKCFRSYTFKLSNNGNKDLCVFTKNANDALQFDIELEAIDFVNMLNETEFKVTEHEFINLIAY